MWDRLVLRVGGTASERARYRCYAEQGLSCVNADGAARLVLSFKNHIRRRGGTVARSARDLRLLTLPGVWPGPRAGKCTLDDGASVKPLRKPPSDSCHSPLRVSIDKITTPQ